MAITFTAPVWACEAPADLLPVGSAELRVWGFKIYRASSYSCSGKLDLNTGVLPKPFALTLKYRRNIERDDLIDNTREQWQKLGYYSAASEPWLRQLQKIWPDVKAGDTLTLFIRADGSSEFFMDDRSIGRIANTEFGPIFAAIWLDAKSTYPDARRQLFGEKS